VNFVGDIAIRLGVATLSGIVVGLNRNLHGKPTGVRTLGLVSLGSALVMVVCDKFLAGPTGSADAVSRVMPGIITGIGFLGAGVILRDTSTTKIHGLTTAATIWLTAALGVASGLGAWIPLAIAGMLVLVLLAFGGRFERAVHSRLKTAEPGVESDGID